MESDRDELKGTRKRGRRAVVIVQEFRAGQDEQKAGGGQKEGKRDLRELSRKTHYPYPILIERPAHATSGASVGTARRIGRLPA